MFEVLRHPPAQRPWWLQLYGVPGWWPWQADAPQAIDLVAAPSAAATPPPPCVLVVDDEPDMRSWLRITLEVRGWRVEEAASAEETLARFDELTPDVLVIDQRMGGMTGLECVAILREDGFARPIVLLSALIDAHTLADAERLGVLPESKVDHGSLLALLDRLHAQLRPVDDLTIDLRTIHAAFS